MRYLAFGAIVLALAMPTQTVAAERGLGSFFYSNMSGNAYVAGCHPNDKAFTIGGVDAQGFFSSSNWTLKMSVGDTILLNSANLKLHLDSMKDCVGSFSEGPK